MADVKATDTVLIAGIITAGATVAVAIIGNVITMYNNRIARKNEHRLAILKVLLEAAYKEYEFRTKQDLEEAKLGGYTAKIKSFTEYIIFYRELAGLFTNENVSENDLIESLSRNKELIDAYYSNKKKFIPDYHDEPPRPLPGQQGNGSLGKIISAIKWWTS